MEEEVKEPDAGGYAPELGHDPEPAPPAAEVTRAPEVPPSERTLRNLAGRHAIT
jgi:hypothetical protein